MSSTRFYESSNGDSWDLVRDDAAGRAFVLHTPNLASGGRPSQIDLDAFLRRHPHSAENAALVALLAGAPAEGEAKDEPSEVRGYIHDPKEPDGPYIAVVLMTGKEPVVTLHTSYAAAEQELAAKLAHPTQTAIAHHQVG